MFYLNSRTVYKIYKREKAMINVMVELNVGPYVYSIYYTNNQNLHQ